MALATLSPARRTAHAVVLRTLARAPTPIGRCTARPAASRRAIALGQAAGLRHRPAPPDAGPHDRALVDRKPAGRPGGAAARPLPAAVPRRGGRPRGDRRGGRAGQARPRGHRMVNAVLRRVRARASSCRPTRRPRGRRSAIRIRAGSSTCGGTGSGPRRRARCWPPTTSPPSSPCASTRSSTRPRGHPRPPRGRDDRRRRPFDALGHPDYGAASSPSRAPASSCRACVDPAAGRAGPRPVRGPRQQDDPPGGADGRHAARSSPTSAIPARAAALQATCARMQASNVASSTRTPANAERSVRPRPARPAVLGPRHAGRTPTCAGA